MGGLFGSGQQQQMSPPPPPPPPPAAIPPTLANASVQAAGANQMKAAALAKGATPGADTTTAGQGDLVPPTTAKASLVG
jgi:hypothetical protein